MALCMSYKTDLIVWTAGTAVLAPGMWRLMLLLLHYSSFKMSDYCTLCPSFRSLYFTTSAVAENDLEWLGETKITHKQKWGMSDSRASCNHRKTRIIYEERKMSKAVAKETDGISLEKSAEDDRVYSVNLTQAVRLLHHRIWGAGVLMTSLAQGNWGKTANRDRMSG